MQRIENQIIAHTVHYLCFISALWSKVPETFYFPIFWALTVHSLSILLRSPVYSVCAHRSQSAHHALTMHSQSVHTALTVCSAFTYHSVHFHLFSFGTPKLKDRSLRVTTKWEKNVCIKVEGNLYLHIRNIYLMKTKM